jgi:hypothetical protein
MNRSIIFAMLVAAMLLVGCGTITSSGIKTHKGTDGLKISFLKTLPPDKVYESRPFPTKVEIHNAGAFNVSYNDMLITFSYDPLYIKGGLSPYDPKQGGTEKDHILGLSDIYPQGEHQTFGVPVESSFEAKPVYGQRISPETEMTASVCYRYKTYLSTDVCIDTNLYEQNQRTQPCTAKDLTFTGGQGAPIAITQIKVQALPRISADRRFEAVRPQFDIRIEDVGQGYLIGPDSLELKNACLLKSIDKTQLNAVVLHAWLLKTPLACGHDATTDGTLVKITEGVGEVSCTVPEDALNDPIYASKQNFQTTMVLNITYIYKASTSKEIEILRVPGSTEDEPTGIENGKVSGYMYDGDQIMLDSAGRKVTQCRYYGDHPNEAPEPYTTVLSSAYSCSCGQERCTKLSRTGQCLLAPLCPANTYCCTDQRATAATDGALYDAVVANPDQVIPRVGSDPSKTQISSMLEAVAAKYGIPADILKAIAYKESTWRCQLTGDGGKSYGLVQIYTVAHPDYNVDLGKSECSYNAEYGASFLKSLHQQEGDWRTAVRRYNGAGTMAENYATDVMAKAQSRPWCEFNVC